MDWSGDATLARRRIFLAESAAPGTLMRLESGRDRTELQNHLIQQHQSVIGLDFGFSFPLTFFESLGLRSTPELWQLAGHRGEEWIERCAPPFWGRTGRPRPVNSNPFRRTELAVPVTHGIKPKSMFQLGGAGAVGTGSIRGMPLLDALHAANATIWPYTRARTPVVVEIYPRLLTGPVNKSSPAARAALLEARYPNLADNHKELAVRTEDAFDAAVSALVMIEHLDDLQTLPPEPDPLVQLEGRIWHPAWRDDPL